MILRGTLPAPQGHLLPGHVHAQGHEKRLGHPGGSGPEKAQTV
jgi:hypothetical protein